MTKTGSGNVGLDRGDQSEFIDVIDVIACLWRAKFYLLVGAALGIATAGVFSQVRSLLVT